MLEVLVFKSFVYIVHVLLINCGLATSGLRAVKF